MMVLLDEGTAAGGNRLFVTSLNHFVGQSNSLSVGKILNARKNILNRCDVLVISGSFFDLSIKLIIERIIKSQPIPLHMTSMRIADVVAQVGKEHIPFSVNLLFVE